MSRERVDAVLRGYDALNRGDLEDPGLVFSNDFEFVPPAILPEAEIVKGADGLVTFMRSWGETFDDFHVRSPSFPFVWTFRGDEIVRIEAMQNRASAMEALGLADA